MDRTKPISNEPLRDKIAELEKRIEALRVGITLNGVVGGCGCNTKTPDLEHHATWCRYYKFSKLLAADDAASLRTGEQVKE